MAVFALVELAGIHHVYVWRLPGGQLAIAAHVQFDNMEHWPSVLPNLLAALEEQGIEHATLEPEEACHEDAMHCTGRLAPHA